MITEELERVLEGASETRNLDFKGACSWDVKQFAKDMLAFSNVRGGGDIIIGVEDKTFKRQGLSIEQLKSFDFDIMKDQIAPFADPHVHFATFSVSDKAGLQFTVIRVFEFEEIPVICSKDSNDTKQSVIYYRSQEKRPASAAVSNAYDMRDIIELATVKMMQRKKALGFSVEDSTKKKLDAELGGL